MVGFPQMENGCSCRDFHDHPAQLRVRCHATSDEQRKNQAKPNGTEVARAGGFRNACGQEGTTPPGRIGWVRAAGFARRCWARTTAFSPSPSGWPGKAANSPLTTPVAH